MNDINFFMTDDCSTGLFSKTANDIFHSKTGALKEAFDKFVNPCNQFYKNKNNLKILDICSGVGYNLKSAIILNKDKNLYIKAIDINKKFAMLSPFINDSIDDINLKLFLLEQLLINNINFDEICMLLDEAIKKNDIEFFDIDMANFIKFLYTEPYKVCHDHVKQGFLHNIYYSYISDSMKYGIKTNNYSNVKIDYIFDDARKALKHDDDKYDVVFLDGFSPQKDPTLWTIDFLNLVKTKINNDSIIVSYSKSTPFRSALFDLNFNVGKTFIDDIDMGTIASQNKSYILNPLSNYDLELISTTSGIPYKDTDLIFTPEQIINNRNIDIKNSTKQSRTSFLKNNIIVK